MPAASPCMLLNRTCMLHASCLFTCTSGAECVLHAAAPALPESCPQHAPPPVCRHNPERYMQLVFAVSSVTMLVPVLFHLSQSKERDSLDPNAPGAPMSQHDCVSTNSEMTAPGVADHLRFVQMEVSQPEGQCCRHLFKSRIRSLQLLLSCALAQHGLPPSIHCTAASCRRLLPGNPRHPWPSACSKPMWTLSGPA